MGANRKRLSTEVRRAIWEAWDKRSAYTGEPVDWGQLHIDHVIPIAKPEKLDDLRTKGLIPADFDENGFENLLPALSQQNLSKSASEMDESALVFFLDKARKKKPVIERRLAVLLNSNDAVKSYLALKVASEKNDVTIEELFSVYAHQIEGTVKLRITAEIDGAKIASANSAVAAVLMDKPFSLGQGTVDEVVLYSPGGEMATCKTCNEFITAQERGFSPLTQTDIKIASMATETTEALRAIRDSTFANFSVLREPIVGLRHLDRWSAEWVTEGMIEPEEQEAAIGLTTIADLVSAGLCKVETLDDYEATFLVPNGLDVVMREIMRADLDGDQWEEILMYHYLTAARSGGTLGGGFVVMARAEDDGLLRMRPYPPVSG